MPNLNCTTPEQSKVLIRLGLNAKTADCYWDYDVQKHEYYPMFMDDQYDDLCIPAWSLNALIGLMPKIAGNYPVLARWVSGDYLMEYVDLNESGECKPKRTEFKDTPLDAAYEMMCWLMKEGYVEDASK